MNGGCAWQPVLADGLDFPQELSGTNLPAGGERAEAPVASEMKNAIVAY